MLGGKLKDAAMRCILRPVYTSKCNLGRGSIPNHAGGSYSAPLAPSSKCHLQWSSTNISPTSRLCDSRLIVTADLCCRRSQADLSMSVAPLRDFSWRYWTNSSATPDSELSQWRHVSSDDMLSNTVTICNMHTETSRAINDRQHTALGDGLDWVEFNAPPDTV